MLVLASSSPYRRDLLARLTLPFRVEVPDVDETAAPAESPVRLAARLARAKAEAVAARLTGAPPGTDRFVVGSDQVATLDGTQPIGKPGTHEAARAQLLAASGRSVRFHTAVTLLRLADAALFSETTTTTVRYRTLSPAEIETYLQAERPYDCAGAARCEGLGISLLEAIDGPDPSALIGLPLIALCRLLTRAGHPPLQSVGASAPQG